MQTTTRAIHGEPTYTRIKREPTKLLSMYSSPPTVEITLEDFELYALDRLQVLRTIETLRLKGVRGDEFRSKLDEIVRTCLPTTQGTVEEIEKDHVSHFILRIAYCRTEDLRRWFLNNESALFRFRLERLEPMERAKFMEQNGLAYDVVSKEDVQRLRAQLAAIPIPNMQAGYQGTSIDITKTQFFRIPFTQALDLVSNRQVYLEDGFAYVPVERLVNIIVARFRTNLSRGLLDAHSSFPYILADSRIAPLITNMSKQYTGRDFSQVKSADAVSIDDLDTLAERSYPLCMRELHHALKRDHKLKHGGRLQYGLFLKGIGLSMEDAIQFWEREFAKIMTTEQFQKQYAYNVRHNYGKEGRRKDYTPYNCTKVIMGTAPGNGEYHGCPFKHYDEHGVARLLERSEIKFGARDEILSLVRGRHYQVACLKHFEISHPGAEALIALEGVGNHPNAYFAASMAYWKEKTAKEKGSGIGGVKREAPDGTQTSEDGSAPMDAEDDEGGSPALVSPTSA